MVAIQRLVGPAALSSPSPAGGDARWSSALSVMSYNVLLPNSVDGWWHYKMYLPPLDDQTLEWSTWEYRKKLLRDRISAVDADVVCLQEVAPVSFESDFDFMAGLGYDGREMFKKGRFRPATFWKTSRLELASDPVHKDRTLLTAFRHRPRPAPTDQDDQAAAAAAPSGDAELGPPRVWYVLNCHLQAGREGQRRVRQINEAVRSVLTLARKLKERNPERHVPLIVCGDFNGGSECGAIRYLEDGHVDETFREDGDPVASSRKTLPLERPLRDVALMAARASNGDDDDGGAQPPSATLVVPELISLLVEDGHAAYENPTLSSDMKERLERIYRRFATEPTPSGSRVMNVEDVERWLVAINRALGRGSEYREAARKMGWKGGKTAEDRPTSLPSGGRLTLRDFVDVYEAELRAGKFWGIAHDAAVLGEPLPVSGVFESRYDRIYCSAAAEPVAAVEFPCLDPCPNRYEPSDHLPVAAKFIIGNV